MITFFSYSFFLKIFCFVSVFCLIFFIGLISLYCPLFTDSNNLSTQVSQICLHQFIFPWRHPPWTSSFSYSLCWALLAFKAAVILVLSFHGYLGYSCLSPQRHFLFSVSHEPRASQSLSFEVTVPKASLTSDTNCKFEGFPKSPSSSIIITKSYYTHGYGLL